MDHAPFLPMEGKAGEALPRGDGWQYEPKWDGFRCLAFTGNGPGQLFSRTGKPLARYFPDVAAALDGLPETVLDGELIIPVDGHLSFEALQMRLHPAASRVAKLSAATPALFMAFDRLDDLEAPLDERRTALKRYLAANRSPVLRLSPMTNDEATANKWLARAGGALDGVVAKRRDEAYRPGTRAMLKIKNWRDADCVVGGFRAKSDGSVASLLLGLYNDDGKLDHVGFSAALGTLDRHALAQELRAIAGAPGFSGAAPGGPSRWNNGIEKQWVPLKPERVVEVRYDHASGGRFRHGTTFARWRPDKPPAACTVDQLRTHAGPAVFAIALRPTA